MRDTAVDKVLPPRVRTTYFAANELLLELLHITQSYAKVDLEALLILLCTADATMRPLLLSPAQPPPTAAVVDESLRGSISRRLIADKTGLPRETVRRRVDDLVKAGLLIVDDRGSVRVAPLLADPDLQAAIDQMALAVKRYQKRLVQFGVEPGSGAQPANVAR